MEIQSRIPLKIKIFMFLAVCCIALIIVLVVVSHDDGSYRAVKEMYIQNFPPPKDVTVAYAISVTFCHPDDFIADAAGVLKHSIHLVSSRELQPKYKGNLTDEELGVVYKKVNDAGDMIVHHRPQTTMSRYDYKMYAFVHPDARNCTSSLKQLGYTVMEKKTPVTKSEMKNKQLRRDATTTGCCQEKEFLKLYALTLTEHPIVVHLDLDTVLLQPLDNLFDPMMLPDADFFYMRAFGLDPNKISDRLLHHPEVDRAPILKTIPEAMWSPEKKIPITAYFTRDYNSAKEIHETPPNRVNIQGGFWIVKPHKGAFEELREIIKDGHQYSSEWGWGGRKKMSYKSAWYGTAQVQGLISYYHSFVRPGGSVELNKCLINNMVDQPRKGCYPTDQQMGAEKAAAAVGMTGQCEDCRNTELSKIKSIHFTICQKPWWCPLWIEEPQCAKFHYEWHRIRQDLEVAWDLASPIDADAMNAVDTTDMKKVLSAFPRHCRRQGSKGYQPIPFPFLKAK